MTLLALARKQLHKAEEAYAVEKEKLNDELAFAREHNQQLASGYWEAAHRAWARVETARKVLKIMESLDE